MIVLTLRLVLKLFYIFPIKRNKVVLQAYNGRLFTCSPKYLAEALLKTGRYDVYFALKDSGKQVLPEGMKYIKYRSLSHFYHLMTAGFVVVNSSGIPLLLPYRKTQTIIQTWHGGYSFKVIGIDFFKDSKSINNRKISGSNITYFLSGSTTATEQHSHAMCVDKKNFLNIGLPRNDVLFDEHGAIRQKIYQSFNIPVDANTVLYAPTYRDGPVKAINEYDLEQIDVTHIVDALNRRFGGRFVFLYKAHHDMIPANLEDGCINASDYPDIQELMCASDVLITDYSSCMSDFALQKKPGFLYTPDLAEYEAVHPFSMEPGKWPYTTARSNEEIINNILTYSEAEGIKKIENFFERIGNCENGHACEAMIKIMDKHIGN